MRAPVRDAEGNSALGFVHVATILPRGTPGGVDGLVLKEKNSQQSISVDLDELRQNLVKYLDTFAKENPFPYADRPLELKDLKVVAFVQDDATGEILQAAQIDLGGAEYAPLGV